MNVICTVPTVCMYLCMMMMTMILLIYSAVSIIYDIIWYNMYILYHISLLLLLVMVHVHNVYMYVHTAWYHTVHICTVGSRRTNCWTVPISWTLSYICYFPICTLLISTILLKCPIIIGTRTVCTLQYVMYVCTNYTYDVYMYACILYVYLSGKNFTNKLCLLTCKKATCYVYSIANVLVLYVCNYIQYVLYTYIL
jgi:hypothetical protein